MATTGRWMLALATVLVVALCGPADAADYIWDNNLSTGDGLWSTATNWNPDAGVGDPNSDDRVQFQSTYFDANTVDADTTVRYLEYEQTTGSHNTTIDPGVTLTVNNGLLDMGNVITPTAATTTTIGGAGTLQLGGASATQLRVGYNGTNTTYTSTLTIDATTNFSNVSYAYVGYSNATNGATHPGATLNLSDGTDIAGQRLYVGWDAGVGTVTGVGDITLIGGNATGLYVGASSPSNNNRSGAGEIVFGDGVVPVQATITVAPTANTGYFDLGVAPGSSAQTTGTLTNLRGDSTVTLGGAGQVDLRVAYSTAVSSNWTGKGTAGSLVLDTAGAQFNAVNVRNVYVGYDTNTSGTGTSDGHTERAGLGPDVGVLDLSGATLSDGTTTGQMTITNDLIIGKGRRADGTVYLPEAHVTIGRNLTIGGTDGWNKAAYDASGRLYLDGTLVTVDGVLKVDDGAVVEVTLNGVTGYGGLDINSSTAADFSIPDEGTGLTAGRIDVDFNGAPSGSWAIRMLGNQQTLFDSYLAASKIVDTSAIPGGKVFLDATYTYFGLLDSVAWNNPGLGNWDTAGDWLPTMVPGVGTEATVGNGGTANVTTAGVATNPYITNGTVNVVSGGGSLAINSLVDISSGSSMSVDGPMSTVLLNLDGGLSIASGKTATVSADATVGATGSVTGSGTLDVAGTLDISGSVASATVGASTMNVSATGSIASTTLNATTLDVVGGGSANISGTLTADSVTATGTVSAGTLLATTATVSGGLTVANPLSIATLTQTAGTVSLGNSLTVDTLDLQGGTMLRTGLNKDVTVNTLLNLAGQDLDMTGAAFTGGAATDITIGTGRTLTVDTAVSAKNLNIQGTLVRNNGGTAGDVTVAGNLTVVGCDLDMTGSTLTAPNTVTVTGRNLTVDKALTVTTMTVTNGTLNGASGLPITATTHNYNNTTVNADLAGTNFKANDKVVVLNGTTNTYTGYTRIGGGADGVLRVLPNAANIPTASSSNYLDFNNGILETSGTFAANIQNSNGGVYWRSNGGFAAYGADLTVTLEGGANLTWNNAGIGFNSRTLYLSSTTATGMVDLTNNIALGSKTVTVQDNPAVKTDYARMSGAFTNTNWLYKSGTGVLELAGSHTALARVRISSGVVRVGQDALPANGLPGGHLYFNNGVLEAYGTFSRPIANANGSVYWNSHGGFAAHGGDLTVDLGGSAAPVSWTGATGLNAKYLYLGSTTADGVVDVVNPLVKDANNRRIYAYDNPDSSTDLSLISGAISGGSTSRWLDKYGDGELELSGTNTYVSITGVRQGTLNVSGSLTQTYYVDVFSGATLMGAGNITTTHATTGIQVRTGGTVAPGGSIGTLTQTGNFLVQNNGVVEWEVSAAAQDLIVVDGDLTLTGGWDLVIIDEGGFYAQLADEFELFTCTGTPSLGAADVTIISSDPSWDVSGATISLFVDGDGLGHVILSNIEGGEPVIPEPATVTLLAVGGLFALARRRKR